jgi:hypothetical protein
VLNASNTSMTLELICALNMSQSCSSLKEAGLVEFDGDVIRLTRAGCLSNEVFAAFV